MNAMLRRSTPESEAGQLLARLYKEHASSAYRYAFHLTGRREDADDLVQIAFLQLHRALLAGVSVHTPGAWLATVIKRRAINLLASRREQPGSDRLDQLDHPGEREAVEEASAQLAEIRALLYTLPEPQHHAFVLRHWSGLSHREIAAVLDTSEAAVESLLVRARAAVMAHADTAQTCGQVSTRLAAEQPLSAPQAEHLTHCSRCRTAERRLAKARSIAAAALLTPSLHVTHALAAVVPGFSATAAAPTTATAAAGTKAGLTAVLTKTAATTLAIAATAVAIHTHLHPIGLRLATPPHALHDAAPRVADAAPSTPTTPTPPAPDSGMPAPARSDIDPTSSPAHDPSGRSGGASAQTARGAASDTSQDTAEQNSSPTTAQNGDQNQNHQGDNTSQTDANSGQQTDSNGGQQTDSNGGQQTDVNGGQQTDANGGQQTDSNNQPSANSSNNDHTQDSPAT